MTELFFVYEIMNSDINNVNGKIRRQNQIGTHVNIEDFFFYYFF